MKHYFTFILSLSFFIASCNEDTVNEIPSIEKEVLPADTIPTDTIVEEPKQTLIFNNNVVEKLTAYGDSNQETHVLIKTTYGNMKVRLFKETPLHRSNFIMLAKKKFFDSTKFYRIIDKFMIQGGNSDDEEIANKMLAIGSYKIPNEINPAFAHVKGAIAMAVSPEEQSGEKRSSAMNFYIIEGRKLSNTYLQTLKDERGITITPYNKKRYLDVGGAPHLDGNYTVFGEVYAGFGTLNRISSVKTDQYDWPLKPVYITSVEVIK